jgi:signal transduction histidine kinase
MDWAALSLNNKTVLQTIESPDSRFKARVISASIHQGQYIIQIGKIIRDTEELTGKFSRVFAGAVFVMLVCGIVFSWLGTTRIMRGVERITETALRIGKEGLGHRVPLENKGIEIDRLAQAFNNMLDRIETLMAELREVTHNIAHDLRTPLTRIRGLAETALHGSQDMSGYQEGYEIIMEESERLVHLINTMLDIAEADAGLKQYKIQNFDIGAMVKKGYELFLPVAQDKDVRFDFEGLAGPLYIQGDMPKWQRVLSNLLDNAIKFTGKGGTVSLAVRKHADHVEISVKDTGIGMEEQHVNQIFKKFYRIDNSRSQPGNGLGLSWVKSILQSMGGTIDVKSVPGHGSHFTDNIPINPSV